jgi:hypothetical protein
MHNLNYGRDGLLLLRKSETAKDKNMDNFYNDLVKK